MGKSTKLIGVIVDITDRKIADELAQRHLDELEAIYKAAPVGLCVLDRELRWVQINERLAEMNGFTVAEHIGKRVRDLIPNVAEEIETKLREVIETGEPVLGLEFAGETPAQPGVIRSWKENWFPIRDRSGAVVGINVVAEEVTAARRAEREREALLESERAAREQAERSGRLRDEFLATVSHELRTPLNAILGWADILLMSLPPDSEMRHGLEVIGRNARSQAQLIEELLDMSRIVAGKLTLEWRQVELQTTLSACIDNLFPAAQQKRINIRREIDRTAPAISGDSDRLQQVIWNLLSNSIKFTPAGGEVRVSLQKKNSDLELTISDTGMGIKPEFLLYVFDRFRQGDASTARQHAGLGLGLAIVKSIVEMHGGMVAVESQGEGRGASFTVKLPISGMMVIG
ncbi:MAG: PAS domain-containing sensor histidine kinase [Acidobacteria bacterium]|nr:PAS domain-containing sensor histidine kinase [Acidobacteriota bacterium]